MSARDRMLIRILAPIAVLAVVWLAVLSPKLDAMKSAGEDVKAARSALVVANTQLVDAKTNSAAIRAQQRKLLAAGRAVPASLAIPSLLRQLERVAKRAGIGLDAVAQGGSPASGASAPATAGATAPGVDATSVSLNLDGRYRNVRRFLTQLDNLVRVSGETVEGTGRLVSISSIGVAPAESAKLKVVVETTVYTLQDHAAAAAAAAAPLVPGTSTDSSSGASASVTPAAVSVGG